MYTKGKLEVRNIGTGQVIIESHNIAHSIRIASVDNLGIETQLANARRLVKCWNTHDELLEACKGLVSMAQSVQEWLPEDYPTRSLCARAEFILGAEQIIAKAESEAQ